MVLQLFPARVQAWIMGTGVTLAIGAAAGSAAVLAWEHGTPWGLAARLDRAETARDTATADLGACRRDRARVVGITHEWRAAYDRLDARRIAERDAAARAVDARAAETAAQCRAAFNAGVTAGRALGRPDDETNPDSDRDGGDAGVLRDDLAAAWRSGAFGHAPGD